MAESDEWFTVARLLRPQGRKGELLSEPLTDVAGIFDAGRVLTLLLDKNTPRPLAVADSWQPSGRNAGRIVLKLEGCDSIDAAEALVGGTLALPSREAPTLENDTFFVRDLIGCSLFDGDFRAGSIVDVQFATGPDGRSRLEDAAVLFAVETQTGAEPTLVPFIKAWLVRVDLPSRTIVMHLPKGLLDAGGGDTSMAESAEDEG